MIAGSWAGARFAPNARVLTADRGVPCLTDFPAIRILEIGDKRRQQRLWAFGILPGVARCPEGRLAQLVRAPALQVEALWRRMSRQPKS